MRVFCFSAGFPFFSNVDELAHFDLVMKYSHGHIPKRIETFSVETARYREMYSSWEYSIHAQKNYRLLKYETASDSLKLALKENILKFCAISNHESSQPPLYYLLAGAWTNLGVSLGIEDLRLLYWIRFLNIFFIITLVWLAYFTARNLFPGDAFLVLGLPLLVACLPQDTYYSIQNDVLSPLCFAFTFLFLVLFLRAEIPQAKHGILTGIFLACTSLVKVSNLPLLMVVAFVLFLKALHLSKENKLKSARSAFLGFVICSCAPLLLWVLWNLSTHGDLTGSENKMRLFGWQAKEPSQWLNNPLFTVGGFSNFWKEFMASFWRGEFIWAGERIKSTYADFFYWSSSVIFILTALLFVQRKITSFQKNINRLAALCFFSLLILMIFLSISIDFGMFSYPSASQPYFTSGRLISAALIPFLLLYLQGLNWFLSWINSNFLRFIILAALMFAVSLSELNLTEPVFASHFNWFHI